MARSTVMSGFRLRVVAGPDRGKQLEVAPPLGVPVLIGRGVDAQAGLLCADDRVSRQHASIELSADGYLLRDRGSTNRTRLNGRLVDPAIPVILHDHDEIVLGPQTIVVFELTQSAAREGQGAVSPPRYRFRQFAVYEALDRTDLDRVDVAVDTTTGEAAALKRIEAGELPRPVRERILEEALRARRWQHPGIAAILQSGTEGDVIYIASRLIDGMSLAAVQDRRAPDIEPAMAAHLVREVAAVVRYAGERQRGFVHGNLNPRNIMISYEGEVVLINFALTPAKALLESALDQTRTRLRYSPREHTAPDAAADAYALGVILYELLARQPIDAQPHPLPPIHSLQPHTPHALAALAMRAVTEGGTEVLRARVISSTPWHPCCARWHPTSPPPTSPAG